LLPVSPTMAALTRLPPALTGEGFPGYIEPMPA
jgi:hypothetical protein